MNTFYDNRPYQFTFDKIYPNKVTMDENCAIDGVLIGRYVYINYYIDSIDGSMVDYYESVYVNNARADASEGLTIGPKFHGTVWQKILNSEGAQCYILIAKLMSHDNYFPQSFTPLFSEKKIVVIDDDKPNNNKIIVKDNGDFSITINGEWKYDLETLNLPSIYHMFLQKFPIPVGEYQFSLMLGGNIRVFDNNDEEVIGEEFPLYIKLSEENESLSLTKDNSLESYTVRGGHSQIDMIWIDYNLKQDYRYQFNNLTIRPELSFIPDQLPTIVFENIAPTDDLTLYQSLGASEMNYYGGAYRTLWPSNAQMHMENYDYTDPDALIEENGVKRVNAEKAQKITDIFNEAGFHPEFQESKQEQNVGQHAYKDYADVDDIYDFFIKTSSGKEYPWIYDENQGKLIENTDKKLVNDEKRFSLRLTSVGTKMGQIYDLLYGADRHFLNQIKDYDPFGEGSNPSEEVLKEYSTNRYIFKHNGDYCVLVQNSENTSNYDPIPIPGSSLYEIYVDYLTTFKNTSLVIERDFLQNNILSLFDGTILPSNYDHDVITIQGGATLIANYTSELSNDAQKTRIHIFTLTDKMALSDQSLFSILATIPAPAPAEGESEGEGEGKYGIEYKSGDKITVIVPVDNASGKDTLINKQPLYTTKGIAAVDGAFTPGVPVLLLVDKNAGKVYINPAYATYS